MVFTLPAMNLLWSDCDFKKNEKKNSVVRKQIIIKNYCLMGMADYRSFSQTNNIFLENKKLDLEQPNQ